ncbi:hypothetical protein ACTD5D_40210 [Nocardia takedensis]|uniref:hypothetical protein n=1 Tax=Nocardia takedensis TaxID=259390 RepID=UPI003F777669
MTALRAMSQYSDDGPGFGPRKAFTRGGAGPDGRARACGVGDSSRGGASSAWPWAEELCDAVRGRAERVMPLLVFAQRLGEVFDDLIGEPQSPRPAGRGPRGGTRWRAHRRGEIHRLAREIDLWVVQNVPRAPGGVDMHTESLGRVVARLAAAQVWAVRTLLAWGAEDLRVRQAWRYLAELRQGYDALAPKVRAGLCDVPTSCPEIDGWDWI